MCKLHFFLHQRTYMLDMKTNVDHDERQPASGLNAYVNISGHHLLHFQRVLTATFIWLNGLNPEVYYDWCELKSFFYRGSAMHRHFQQLFHYFRQCRRYSLWSLHVLNRQYEWLDGTVCYVQPRERRR